MAHNIATMNIALAANHTIFVRMSTMPTQPRLGLEPQTTKQQERRHSATQLQNFVSQRNNDNSLPGRRLMTSLINGKGLA